MSYPGSLDNLPAVTTGQQITASGQNGVITATNAIESTLGINPQGSFSTVGAAVAAKADVTDVQNSALTFGDDTGGINAYAMSLSPAPSGYVAGLKVSFVANNTNTGNSTLDVNSLGAVAILRNGNGLGAGTIVDGQVVEVTYDGDDFQIDIIAAIGREPCVNSDITQLNGLSTPGILGTLYLDANQLNEPALVINQHSGVGGGAEPNTIAGLLGWWKADSISQADGTPVSTWDDSSGNDYNLTSSIEPIFKVAIVNGYPVVRFGGAQGMAVSSFPLGVFTFFAVFSASADGLIYEQSANAYYDNGSYLYTTTDESTRIKRGSGTSGKNLGTSWGSTGTFMLVEQVFDGTNASHQMYINAVEQSLSATSDDGDGGTAVITDTLNIACRNQDSTFITADYAEIIFYNQYLSTSERTLIENYLAAKYNISLPSAQTGPYFDVRNTSSVSLAQITQWGRMQANGFNTGIAVQTTTYTLADTDSIILAGASAAAFTVTLPTSVGRTGAMFTVKKTDSSSNAVTLATTASQTIDGSATYSLSTQNATVVVASDGANWWVIATV